MGGISKGVTAGCGNQKEVVNKENIVENVMGVELEEEGCSVVSSRLLEKGFGLPDKTMARDSFQAEIGVVPKPVVNLNMFGEVPIEETHQTWASRLNNSEEEILDSESKRVGDAVRTQKETQLGPENSVDNMVEALDLACCGQTSKRAVLELKTNKAFSEIGQQMWASRLNECFNVGKGFYTLVDKEA
ncbi:hypothetical protein V6N13_082564 [Hibiscus sabdariffa]|uniref:Uncharacterized protein n=1 Tax=Hibiscus sabdariffa TaxID=183260 RepID=A0ABR2Q4G6_9ROSI